MAKSARNRPEKVDTSKSAGKSFAAVDNAAFDPTLSFLFASSLGPVKPPTKSLYQSLPGNQQAEDSSEEEEASDAASEEPDGDEGMEDAEDASGNPDESSSGLIDDDESASKQSQLDHEEVLARVRESVLNGEQERPNKKRKRGNKEDEVEDVYLRKLAREELKEEEKRNKQKMETVEADDASEQSAELDGESYTIPKHETQIDTEDTHELDKAARTVFLGNVSSEAITSKSAKKTLLRHLGSFIDDLADHKPPHKVESLRFRSTAFANALPKRAAFAKKEVMDATTKSTNAYAVYSTQLAAREATKRLNGTVILDRHLRADLVAHPAKVDNRRCIFVGNLGFIDDESNLKAEDGEKKKKNKPPSDVEEGLWVQFGKAGKVESVRVIRDQQTRIGKGFAYVQFEDENGVEAALQFNDQKYPPLLPRKLRVVRAKAPKRKDKKPTSTVPKANSAKSNGVYNAKVTDQQKTEHGRARAMLGKAGAAKAKESFVFEGHRASSKQGTSGFKLGGKKKGKLSNRSSKRAAAWKKAGGKPSK